MDDVRIFLMDRGMEDNPIDLVPDFFQDDDIRQACRRCVAKFNETPPFNLRLNANSLPYRTYLLAGIGWQVYLAKINQLSRQDLDYDAGGMSVDLVGTRIKHFTRIAQDLKKEFMEGLHQEKVAKNYSDAFCQVG